MRERCGHVEHRETGMWRCIRRPHQPEAPLRTLENHNPPKRPMHYMVRVRP